MRGLRSQRGTTLVEAMFALFVIFIGAFGLISAHKQGLRFSADARRISRASAIAQDLVEQIALWPYTDPRFTTNHYGPGNLNIGDPGQSFESSTSPMGDGIADHSDAELTPANYQGIPTAALFADGAAGGTRLVERYWNVACVDDDDNGGVGNGVFDACRIAVIVRWGDPQRGYRRIVSLTTKI